MLLDGVWAGVGGFLLPNIGIFVFIHAFAWIFVLSSVIPAIILGRGSSILLQFILCLTLTLVATSIGGILDLLIGVDLTAQLQASSAWFLNPLAASLYLSAPYVFMLYMDLRSKRRRQRADAESAQVVAAADQLLAEQPLAASGSCSNSADTRQALLHEARGSIGYLQGAAAACLLLAVLTIWMGSFILSPPQVVFNATAQIAFGASLLLLGRQKHPQVAKVIPRQRGIPRGETAQEGGAKTLQEYTLEPGSAALQSLVLKTEDPSATQAETPAEIPSPTSRYCVRRPKYVVDSQC